VKILIFNWHEAYIYLLAKTGHTFHICPPMSPPGDQTLHVAGREAWDRTQRPLPARSIEISRNEAREWKDGYDLIICLAPFDVQATLGWGRPMLFIQLNMIGTDMMIEDPDELKEATHYLTKVFNEMPHLSAAFISEKKKANWPGMEQWPVVKSGIDPGDFEGSWDGCKKAVLTVGNMLAERDRMQGWAYQYTTMTQLPEAGWTVMGMNPTLADMKLGTARKSKSWSDMLLAYGEHRCLLVTLQDQHEDGYNLAMLEAMMMGCPIVTMPNSTSPIEGGSNGLVGATSWELAEHIQSLMEDWELALHLGDKGTATVLDNFSISHCINSWSKVMEDAANV
tara:strand:+ start:8644 stop:9657 length:1014 start_codon:yes stop_codon:yes gene_type:complete